MTHNIEHDSFVEELKKTMQKEREDIAAGGGLASMRDTMGWERGAEERMVSLRNIFENDERMKPEEGYVEEFATLMSAFDEAIFADRATDAWDIFEKMRGNFGYIETLNDRPWHVKSAIFDKLLPEMERAGEGESAALLAQWSPQNPEGLEALLEKSKLYYVMANGGNMEEYLSCVDETMMKNPEFVAYIESLRKAQEQVNMHTSGEEVSVYGAVA
ncbi:MAG: hypothetical protein HGA67_02970 [Candidatus Yonathbacteria bacterium]|nr:hypothetical protein [Candidatus Yonathbacteria bacterium]